MNIKTSLNEAELFVIEHLPKDSFKWIEQQINQSIICFSVFENRSKYSLIWPSDFDKPDEQVVWDLWEGKQTTSINVLEVYNDTSERYYIVESFDFIFEDNICPICHNNIVDYKEHKLVHGILSNKVDTPTMLPNPSYRHMSI